MYTKHFGLTFKPFSLTPNPKALFESAHHSMALTYLEYGLREKLGFVLLTGEVGTGKTTLLQSILSTIEDEMEVAEIFNTNVTSGELIKLILQEFEIETVGPDKTENLSRLYAFLIDRYAQGKRCLLVIDEAQNLSRESMEEVRMLSNLSTDTETLLQIILAGQPELKKTLNEPHLRQLVQRISVAYHLTALEPEETAGYISHRLALAGGIPTELFDQEAVTIVHEYSAGIPRMINILCDAALLYAFADDKGKVDREIVEQVVRERQDYWPGKLEGQEVLEESTEPDSDSALFQTRVDHLITKVENMSTRLNMLEQTSQIQEKEHLNRLITELKEQVKQERRKNERLNLACGSLRQRVQELENIVHKEFLKKSNNEEQKGTDLENSQHTVMTRFMRWMRS